MHEFFKSVSVGISGSFSQYFVLNLCDVTGEHNDCIAK
jgi:hypothetical protein